MVESGRELAAPAERAERRYLVAGSSGDYQANVAKGRGACRVPLRIPEKR